MRANVRLLDYIVAASFITLPVISLFLVCVLYCVRFASQKKLSISALRLVVIAHSSERPCCASFLAEFVFSGSTANFNDPS
jgi:hypothetical protein